LRLQGNYYVKCIDVLTLVTILMTCSSSSGSVYLWSCVFFQELTAVNKDHEENALKRDLVIHGLAKVVRQKEKEVGESGELN